MKNYQPTVPFYVLEAMKRAEAIGKFDVFNRVDFVPLVRETNPSAADYLDACTRYFDLIAQFVQWKKWE